MNDTHESPVDVSLGVVIEAACDRKMAHDLVGADQVDAKVTSTGMVNVHGDGDVLEALQIGFLDHVWGDVEADGQALVSLRDGLVDMNPGREEPGLRLDILPGLRGLDNGVAIDLAIAECVAELLSDGGVLPVAGVKVDGDGGIHGEVLHVSPRDVRTDLEHEGENTGSKRGGRRSTAVTIGARVLADISGVLTRES